MSLTPRVEFNFDGVGLLPDDDYVLDVNGVGHFHKVKAEASWSYRLKVTGVDTTTLSWDCDVRGALGDANPILSTSLVGDAQITVIPDPDGDDTEEVEFLVTGDGTALLQSGSTGNSFVFDIIVTQAGKTDVWFGGSGETVPAVTR